MNKGYFVLDEISEMGRISSQMGRDAADVFVNENRGKIDEILKKEERVDELYKSIFPILKNAIEKKCEKCPNALNLILIAKFLERIADHSVNIANRAMYEMSGEEEYL